MAIDSVEMNQAYANWLEARKDSLCGNYERELTEQTSVAFEEAREYALEIEPKIEFLATALGSVGQSSTDYADNFFNAFEDALLAPVEQTSGEPMTTVQMITLADGSTRTVEVTVIETPPPSFGDVDSGLVISEAYKEACVEGPEEYEEAQRAIDEINRQLQILAYIDTLTVEACNEHEADLMALADQIPMFEMSMVADEMQICKTAFDIAVAEGTTEAADEIEFCDQMRDMCADAMPVSPITIMDLDEAEFCPEIDMSLYETQLMQLETLSVT